MSAAFSPRDLECMARAIQLAGENEGLTRPNPPVGAVIVNAAGRMVGEGAHKKAGTPHAEIHALHAAHASGASLDGATLYVTLEPCCTHGKTPPCTEAILNSGIRRVVVGAIDPNPAHAGQGIQLLRHAGVEVELGALSAEAEELIAPFRTHILQKRPFFTLKLGTSLDGRIADLYHHSRWITGPDAREQVQAWRRKSDVIMVGAGTVRHDNPSLWPRPDGGRSPYRVVVVREGILPADAKLFTDAHLARTIVAAPEAWQPDLAATLRKRGVIVWELPKENLLSAMAAELGKLGLLRVFCEGGGQLAEALIRQSLVDELHIFLSPMLLGGPVGAMGGAGWPLEAAPRFQIHSSQSCGKDWHIRLLPSTEKEPE